MVPAEDANLAERLSPAAPWIERLPGIVAVWSVVGVVAWFVLSVTYSVLEPDRGAVVAVEQGSYGDIAVAPASGPAR